jgi:hypothetical protein
MRIAAVICAFALTGCPAAFILGAAAKKGQESDLHPITAHDYDAWTGAPKVQVETHRYYGTLPREVRAISDGSEMWLIRHCAGKECCLHQFIIESDVVTQYRTTGPCGFDCKMWPEPKVKTCEGMGSAPLPKHLPGECEPAPMCQ